MTTDNVVCLSNPSGTTYSSMTTVSTDYTGWGASGETLEKAQASALRMHAFASSVRPVGTTVTTEIYQLCNACHGAGMIYTKRKPYGARCKACKGAGTIGIIETIVSTIGA